jgi:hypothetical protein
MHHVVRHFRLWHQGDAILDARMFIRFVVGRDGEHHKALTGVVTEARVLTERAGLTHSRADGCAHPSGLKRTPVTKDDRQIP